MDEVGEPCLICRHAIEPDRRVRVQARGTFNVPPRVVRGGRLETPCRTHRPGSNPVGGARNPWPRERPSRCLQRLSSRSATRWSLVEGRPPEPAGAASQATNLALRQRHDHLRRSAEPDEAKTDTVLARRHRELAHLPLADRAHGSAVKNHRVPPVRVDEAGEHGRGQHVRRRGRPGLHRSREGDCRLDPSYSQYTAVHDPAPSGGPLSDDPPSAPPSLRSRRPRLGREPSGPRGSARPGGRGCGRVTRPWRPGPPLLTDEGDGKARLEH